MKLISKKEDTSGEPKQIFYKFDDTIQVENIGDVLKMFELEGNKIDICYVSTYSESGSVSQCSFNNIDDLKELETFPNPSMSFVVDYVNTVTNQYSYSIEASTNVNYIVTYVDKKKQKEYNETNSKRIMK